MRDLDVRTALRRELAQQHSGDDRTLIVEEMGIWSGSVRVDVAVVNGDCTDSKSKALVTPWRVYLRNKVSTAKSSTGLLWLLPIGTWRRPSN